jgi:hypothetical protein
MKNLLFAPLFLTTFFFGHVAYGQADLTFSGGNGTPLTIDLLDPLTFTINTTAVDAPLFVFEGTTDVAGTDPTQDAASTITYSVDGGLPQPIFAAVFGESGGSLTADNFFIAGSAQGITAGDTITLSAGTVTTVSDFSGAPLANGVYPAFISDGTNAGFDGVAAPEPSVWAALVAGMVFLIPFVRRRRREAGKR